MTTKTQPVGVTHGTQKEEATGLLEHSKYVDSGEECQGLSSPTVFCFCQGLHTPVRRWASLEWLLPSTFPRNPHP